jgi:hypothetical protein
MTFKSLLLAATLAGGLAFGASAANAAVLKATVTGTASDNGSFDFFTTPLPYSTSANEFYTAFDGTGAYTGISSFSVSGLASVGYPADSLFYDSNSTNFVITTDTQTSLSVSGGQVLTGGAYTVSAAPEPGMWALMIAGVAMIGAALRVSRKQGALAVA